ncbi:MAG: hypothetical protein K6C36_08925 [Clostridia bacterium]|nr:hypothetical protein [Clostridia bacterium]
MVSKERLSSGMEELVAIGPKLTGSEGQMRFIGYVKDRIAEMGFPVCSDPFYFDYWRDTAHELAFEGEDGFVPVEVSSVHPYSGETPPEGVTAPMIYLNKVDRLVKAQGRIVVFKVEDLSSVHSELAFDRRGAYPEDTVMPAFYNGPVATAMVKCLAEGVLKLTGCVAAVFVWDGIPDAAVEGQYMPFIQDYLGLPVLWVNATQGAGLIAAAKEGRTARLVLTADKRPMTYTESFYSIIPGSDGKECVIINTHTDGPNAIEENGALALLELMDGLRGVTPRRTHIFVFTTGHFRLPVFRDIRTGSFQSASKWMAKHRNLWDGAKNHLKCVANLAIEHLGCMEWAVVDGEYVPTGKPDVEMVYTGNAFMDRLYLDTVREHRSVTRSITLKGHNLLHFGEGQNFFTMGIPGICLVPGPYYLCVESPGMEHEKFDLELMAQQTETFRRLMEKLEETPTEELGRSEGYSIIEARSVSGGENFGLAHLAGKTRVAKLIKKLT